MSAIFSGTLTVQAEAGVLSDTCMKVFETTLEEAANSVRLSAQNILVSNMLSQTENGGLVELTYQLVMVQLCIESCQSSDYEMIDEFMELMISEFTEDSFTNMLHEQAKDCGCCVELEEAVVLDGTMNIDSIEVITSSSRLVWYYPLSIILLMFIHFSWFTLTNNTVHHQLLHHDHPLFRHPPIQG